MSVICRSRGTATIAEQPQFRPAEPLRDRTGAVTSRRLHTSERREGPFLSMRSRHRTEPLTGWLRTLPCAHACPLFDGASSPAKVLLRERRCGKTFWTARVDRGLAFPSVEACTTKPEIPKP